MTEFDAKKYLREVYYLDKRIKGKMQHAAALREMATKATSFFSATQSSGTASHSKVEDATVKLIDLQRDVDNDVDMLVDRKRDIMRMISAMSDEREKLVLELRYINLWSWARIMREINVEEAQSYRIHKEAIRHFAECN